MNRTELVSEVVYWRGVAEGLMRDATSLRQSNMKAFKSVKDLEGKLEKILTENSRETTIINGWIVNEHGIVIRREDDGPSQEA
jgi:hypothetical protein